MLDYRAKCILRIDFRRKEFKNIKIIGIANAFSGGIFLSVGLLHLLPESTETFNNYIDKYYSAASHKHSHEEKESHFPISFLLAFIGYCLILLVEKIIFDSHVHDMEFTEEANELLKSNSSHNHFSHQHELLNLNERGKSVENINILNQNDFANKRGKSYKINTGIKSGNNINNLKYSSDNENEKKGN